MQLIIDSLDRRCDDRAKKMCHEVVMGTRSKPDNLPEWATEFFLD